MTATIIYLPLKGSPMTDTTDTSADHVCKPLSPNAYDQRFVLNSAGSTYYRTSIIHPSIVGVVTTEVWSLEDDPNRWRTVTYFVDEKGHYHSITAAITGDLAEVMATATAEHEEAIRSRQPVGQGAPSGHIPAGLAHIAATLGVTDEELAMEVQVTEETNAAGEVCVTKHQLVCAEGGIIHGPGPATEDSFPVMLLHGYSPDADHGTLTCASGLPSEPNWKPGVVALPSAPGDELTVYDAVDNPLHYQTGRFGCEAIDLLRYCTYEGGNALKYVWRHADKGKPVEDLRKAAVYATWVRDHKDIVIALDSAEFYGLWNAHVRHRLANLPDIYRAMDYLVRGMTDSAIHLINRTILELTEGEN